jgi:threonyl-tRNA synthetase
MKILSLHTDYIKFKPLKKAIKSLVGLDEKEMVETEVKDDPLVIFTAVEKGDSGAEEMVNEVKKIADQLNVNNIVLYPYAHLSSNLASPDNAVKVLDEAEKLLKKDFKVAKAPFGYYKTFEMKTKGHPMSELSRELKISGDESAEEYDPKQLIKEISKTVLDKSKLKDNDHRIIAQEMDLFSFSETAPGMVFWHNNGLIIRKELIKFWREVHSKAEYEEIKTPQILSNVLWKISGHWEKFKENMFLTEYDNKELGVKPMNCPGGMIVYKNSPKSYKQFPLKVAELGEVHRQELSGVLGGIFRVIQFTQDDAHIFCTDKQVEEELEKVIDLVDFVYKVFGLSFRVEVSTRPEKRIGSDKIWDKTEALLKKVVKKKKLKYKINEGDGAFYGPKIDFHVTDSLGREWQTATLQLDMSMPERFELEYTDKDNKKKRPVMLHRTLYGSLERFMGILIEHYKGWMPTWLAPVQVRVINFTDKNRKYAEEIIKKIGEAVPGIRLDADFSSTTVQSKVKDASIMRIPYVIVVGDREEEAESVAVRVKGNKKIENFSVGEFIVKLKKEIEGRE